MAIELNREVNIDFKKISNKLKVLKKLLPLGFSIVCYMILLICIFMGAYKTDAAMMNLLLTLPLYGVMLMIFRRYKSAFIASSAVLTVIYYVNQFVYSTRLTQIQFNDFFCITDAVRVANKYTLPFNAEIMKDLLIIIAINFLYIYFFGRFFPDTDKTGRTAKFITGSAVLGLSLSVFLVGNAANAFVIPFSGFDINSFNERYGLFYAWYSQYKHSIIKIPENYSSENTMAILGKYDDSQQQTNEEALPDNIIVIMNEALADYSLMGELLVSSDPMESIHELDGNCIKGKAYASVFGGYTSNSEFEFLTGSSMAFLPSYSVPYIQYINTKTISINDDFESLGYSRTAIHPYYSQEWRRQYVYPMLGFENFIPGERFSENFSLDFEGNITDTSLTALNFGDELEYIRGLVSDAECYRKTSEVLAADDEENSRSFVFAVTVQNHGGYSYNGADFTETAYSSYESVNEYLTCSKISSDAFVDFTEQLKQSPEKTAVLMFGDHQPNIGGVRTIYTSDAADNDELATKAESYIVPYIMWANYDVDWDEHENISLNYLSAVFKEELGMPLNAWDNFRLEAYKEYPVITANFAMNAAGEYVSVDTAAASDIMTEYAHIQHMRHFDTESKDND